MLEFSNQGGILSGPCGVIPVREDDEVNLSGQAFYRHALQCVHTAIDMQQQMKVLQRKWFAEGFDDPLQIRCGINTGMATLGGYGSKDRREYTAMRTQVNLASRLKCACEPVGDSHQPCHLVGGAHAERGRLPGSKPYHHERFSAAGTDVLGYFELACRTN